MAEAAFKTTVLNAGKDQKSLTVGWEVLGLNMETATRIFQEEAKEGFLSEREKMYAGQSRKYDKKGNQISKEDAEAEKAADAEAPKNTGPTSNVYECSECGYTLFIAKGREFKFFGESFKCPECGAAKDKMVPKDLEE
jgi:predicted RNA-binding Zn-ribbon protein involved in translation (DUF1610 family)